MCNTWCNFDEWESCETYFKVPLLYLFYSFNFVLPPSLFLFLHWSILSKLLIQGSSWWWSSFFHGLFLNGWRLLSPLFLCLPLHLHGENHHWRTSLKLKYPASIEAPQASFHQITSIKHSIQFRFQRDSRKCMSILGIIYEVHKLTKH